MKTKLLFLLIIISQISCVKEVDYDFAELEPQVVINSLFCPNEYLKVHISKTAGNFDTICENISDAEVILWANNQQIEQLTYDSSGFYSTKSYKMKPNILYTLKVKAEGKNLEASDIIPGTKPSFSVNSITDSNFIEEYLIYSTLSLTLSESLNDSNFYSISCPFYFYDFDNVLNHSTRYIKSNDVIIQSDENTGISYGASFYLIFTNQLINTSEYNLNINFLENAQQGVDLDNTTLVTLSSLSKNCYKFLKSDHIAISFYNNEYSLDSYNTFYYNFFSNVNGGLGIFAGYYPSTDTIILNGVNQY